VRAWAILPDLHWPFEFVDRFASLLPRHQPVAQIERVRLDNCVAEWVRAPAVSSARAAGGAVAPPSASVGAGDLYFSSSTGWIAPTNPNTTHCAARLVTD
jgi:hypothetical protein